MAFVKTVERVSRNDPTDGNPVYYLEGTHETGDTLPTDHVEQGSWSLNLTSKEVVFFNAGTSAWS